MGKLRKKGLLSVYVHSYGNGRKGEGFGMPLGVAKPPMQEPAVRTRCAMGFSDLAWSSAGR
ncbi:hypothetical protein, partial [Devosia naphthalenivorans]|uniref:hypothetical protein n=1 Tax=Devosia naphthalenivorans TaxID=2082392 RepID=UPI001963E4C3